MRRLYPGHVPTTAAQKVVLGASSAVLGFVDPRRTEQVARLGEVTGGRALVRMRDAMRASEEGRAVLRERPCFVEWARLDVLATLPKGSLGERFARFMVREGLDPHSRSAVQYVDDEELAFVMSRYRAVHDVWHVLLGCEAVSVESEVALKWAECAATGLPMTAIAALVGPLKLPPWRWGTLARAVAPWLAANRTALPSLLGVYYEKHAHRSLDELRKELGLTPLHR